ncbi:MAG: hypothetical protein M0Z67_01215 [Nitrospiraceae bacterium]|nr:hypothetical protein [Nitrospiraceae bacterium]
MKISVIVFLVNVLACACISAAASGDGAESLEQAYSPEIQDVIRGTSLEKDFPDSNESADELKVYLGEVDKIDSSIKKRKFGDEINHGRRSDKAWLEESEYILSTSLRRYPESRHLHEALAYINRELGAYTNTRDYLVKAAEEFKRAEELGIKYGKGMSAHYSVVMSQLASQLKDKNVLDNYFSSVFKEFPDDEMSLLWYAQALATMQDNRTEEAFEKALAGAKGNNIDQVVSYSEYLLDQKKYEKALEVLDALPAPLVLYYAPHLSDCFLHEAI